MKIKSLLIIAVLATAILCSAGFVNAQTASTHASLTQQLIQLITQLINQLEQEIQQILAQQNNSTPILKPTCTPNWQCGWGSCVNGYQSQIVVDSNNCGLPASNANIACPTLARACATSSSCIDSDNGKNYYVKGSLSGICTGNAPCGSWIDTCKDSDNLVEYFCDGTNYNTNFVIYKCPNGCENGACK